MRTLYGQTVFPASPGLDNTVYQTCSFDAISLHALTGYGVSYSSYLVGHNIIFLTFVLLV